METEDVDTKGDGKEQDTLEKLLKVLESQGSTISLGIFIRILKRVRLSTLGGILTVFCSVATLSYGVGAKLSGEKVERIEIDGELGWGSLHGSKAGSSFIDGGDATKLHGAWEATWWVDREDGEEERYAYQNQEGRTTIYPTEEIIIKGLKAVITSEVEYSSGEDIWYWYEGRLSAGNNATLIYWVEQGDGREKLVGVVFLKFEEGLKGNKSSTLNGRWIGYVRDGKQVEGRTLWIKK